MAARGWGSDHGAPSTLGAHSATYGSLPLRETERSEPRSRIQWPGGLAHLAGTPSRGKSGHFNKLPLMRGDLELEKNSHSVKCSEASSLSASVEGGSLLLAIQASGCHGEVTKNAALFSGHSCPVFLCYSKTRSAQSLGSSAAVL